MDKAPEAFRTISEVAEWLETPAHVLRFWESRFPQVKPVKRAGGRRYYRPEDMALLGGIKHLLHEQGVTIRGVQKILADQGVRHVAGLSGATPGAAAVATPDTAVDHVVTPKPKATPTEDGALQHDAALGPAAIAESTTDTPALTDTDQAEAPTRREAKAGPSQFFFELDSPEAEDGDGNDTGSAPDPRSETPASATAAPAAKTAPVVAPPAEPADTGTEPGPARTAEPGEPAAAKSDAPAPPPHADPETPDDTLPERALIAARLRAGGRIAADDLAKARALAARLVAMQPRLTGARPGGSPRS